MFKLLVNIYVLVVDSVLFIKKFLKFFNEYYIDKKIIFLVYLYFRVINISFMGLFWLSFCKKIQNLYFGG